MKAIFYVELYLGQGDKTLYEWFMYHQDGRHAHMVVKCFKKIFVRTSSAMILNLGIEYHEVKFCKVDINGDLWLTLTCYTARSNLVAYVFEWGKTITKSFICITFSKRPNCLKVYVYESSFTLGSCQSLSRCFIHVCSHYAQISSFLKGIRCK